MAVSARLERLVAAALGRAGYSGNNTTLVVAVSGGPDSSALLYCLHRLGERHRLRLHVAHLNHDFRGEEAEADARFVTALAQELGLPVTVAKRDPVEYQRSASGGRISSFEQAARELRYAFLADVATDAGAAAVALGHTADDLAETVLLHLLRGSGLHGLRGMAELAPWPWPVASPPDPLSISDGEGVAKPRVRPRFPIYAVFLVSATDRPAHQIFRQFRASFEARNAGFEHLVIFGQHGVSSTVLGLLAGLGLPADATPLLALFASPSATTVYTLPLAGVGEDAEGPWREALARVEDAADRGEEPLDLALLAGFTGRSLKGGPLLEVAGQLVAEMA
jgi:tRNA(Ile)-lysidine synthetase-like protein